MEYFFRCSVLLFDSVLVEHADAGGGGGHEEATRSTLGFSHLEAVAFAAE